jgi:DNA-directed RNA polymerase I, II, and III subunit RPABC5
MLIPMRCFSCGKLISDKWRGYQKELKRLKGDTEPQRLYFDGTKVPETAEKKLLDALNLNQCCRTVFLTHVDLIEKI